MKYVLIAMMMLLVSCSSINKTFVNPPKKGDKVYVGTGNNIDWVSAPPKSEIYPYTIMGILDFIPSAVVDTILLPYTLYDKYY